MLEIKFYLMFLFGGIVEDCDQIFSFVHKSVQNIGLNDSNGLTLNLKKVFLCESKNWRSRPLGHAAPFTGKKFGFPTYFPLGHK